MLFGCAFVHELVLQANRLDCHVICLSTYNNCSLCVRCVEMKMHFHWVSIWYLTICNLAERTFAKCSSER